MLKLYNTAAQKKEIFIPRESGEVKMYVCGVTVYDHCHLGHARAAVVFDVLYRYLRQKGYSVSYVRNYTDVDDKIIGRAAEKGIPWNELAETYIRSVDEDMQALKVLKPTHEPRATEHIGDIISLIASLIQKGMAYAAGGDVFYEVRKFPTYGRLSHKNVEELVSGARIEINEDKRDPLDFALWKKVKPGEPSWPSPWGPGRPGWHIECSAMALNLLGKRLDIHGGGRDLIFPHHENEVAQSEACSGEPFVKHWLHNGLVTLSRAKMSKSTGNFFTIKDLLAHYDYEVIRAFILSAHYRSPLDYSDKNMQDAALSLTRFYETLARLRGEGITPTTAPELAGGIAALSERYTAYMDDDLNTAALVGAVFELVHLVNKVMDAKQKELISDVDYEILEKTLNWIHEGLGIFDPNGTFIARARERHLGQVDLAAAEIEVLLAERIRVRQEKNWARADAIRAQLAEKGIKIKDRPDGTTEWSV